jgi:hypothetical protein
MSFGGIHGTWPRRTRIPFWFIHIVQRRRRGILRRSGFLAKGRNLVRVILGVIQPGFFTPEVLLDRGKILVKFRDPAWKA